MLSMSLQSCEPFHYPGEYYNTSKKRPGRYGTHEEACRESGPIKRNGRLQLPDLFVAQGNIQCFNVRVEMFDLAPTNDGENVGCFVHDVGNGHYKTKRSVDVFMFLVMHYLPVVILFTPTSFATFSSDADTFLSISVRSWGGPYLRPSSPVAHRCSSSASVRNFPLASTFHGASAIPARSIAFVRPSCSVTFGTSHENNLALEIPVHDVPSTLVARDGRQGMVSGILVCL